MKLLKFSLKIVLLRKNNKIYNQKYYYKKQSFTNLNLYIFIMNFLIFISLINKYFIKNQNKIINIKIIEILINFFL